MIDLEINTKIFKLTLAEWKSLLSLFGVQNHIYEMAQ